MTLSEKAAYLRGLADGVKLDETSDTGRILKAVVELLGDMAENIDDLAESQTALGDEVDELSVDLSVLEAKCDDDEKYDDDWDGQCCGCHECGDDALDLSGEDEDDGESDSGDIKF